MALSFTTAEERLLNHIQLPVQPKLLLKIAEEAKKLDPNMNDISSWISEDVSMAAAVLRVVNSPLFARGAKVNSIAQAVMLLGFNRVFPIVKSVALQGAIHTKIDLTDFWQLCNEMAYTCVCTCVELDRSELIDSAYMLGLFHMAGMPVLLKNYPEYQKIISRLDKLSGRDLLKFENEIVKSSHTSVGAYIAKSWGLDSELYEDIYYMLDCEGIFESNELSKNSLDHICILKIARYIVLKKHGLAYKSEWFAIKEGIEHYMNIDATDLGITIHQIENQMATGFKN